MTLTNRNVLSIMALTVTASTTLISSGFKESYTLTAAREREAIIYSSHLSLPIPVRNYDTNKDGTFSIDELSNLEMDLNTGSTNKYQVRINQ